MYNKFILSFFGDFVNGVEKVFYLSLGIVVVLLIGYFLIKSSVFRKFSLYFLAFVVFVGGLFSGVNLNRYYNVSGGIVGELSNVLNPNHVEIDNEKQEIVFDFKGVMLTQVESDKYRAVYTSSDCISLSPNELYGVFVNDSPCEIIEYSKDYTSNEISSDYVVSEFYYAFFDEDLKLILKDRLTFKFAFYKNSTKLIVETNGGSKAVSQWNSYFQKNDFVVQIKPVNNIYISSYSTIKLMNDDEIISSVKIKNGSTYVFPNDLSLDGYRFMGYSLDNSTIISEDSLLITDDVVIYVIFEKVDSICFNEMYEGYTDINSNIICVSDYLTGEALSLYAPENPARYNYTFLGWSLDGETIIDLSTILNDGMIKNVYAVWQPNSVIVNVSPNGGVLTYDNQVYSSDFEFSLLFNEELIFNVPTKDGFLFFDYFISHADSGLFISVSDNTLSLTIDEIFDLLFTTLDRDELTGVNKEIVELDIVVRYLANTDNVTFLSDYDLQFYLVQKSYAKSINEDNELFIRNTYNEIKGSNSASDNLTLFEVEKELLTIYGISTTIAEDTTSRSFLEIVYIYIWESENQ